MPASDSTGGFADAEAASEESQRLFARGLVEFHASHYTEALGVNAAGLAVGYSIVGDAFSTRAFVYDTNLRQLADLNTLVDALPAGVTLSEAAAINALGQIGASSADGHAWLLTPVAPR